MGVEKLFDSLEKTKSIQKNGIHVGFKKKLVSDYFYDDFNSTIYTTASKIEKELNYLLYAIILSTSSDFKLVRNWSYSSSIVKFIFKYKICNCKECIKYCELGKYKAKLHLVKKRISFFFK